MIRALSALLLLAPLACAGSNLAGGSDTKKSSKKPADDEDNEGDKADQPQEVSGAFLTCGPNPDGTVAPGNDPFGCKFADKSGKRLAGKMTGPKLKIVRASGDPLAPVATPTSGDWHVEFDAPEGTADAVSSIELSGKLDGKDVSGRTDNLKGVPSQWESLGTVGASDPNGTDPSGTGAQDSQAPTPKQYVFVTRGAWQPGETTDEQFNNVADATAKCAQAAASGSAAKAKGGSWTPIIAGGGQGPKQRVTLKGDVYDLGDQLIARKDAFWGAHAAAITLDESGQTVSGSPAYVWTGATADGGIAPDTCNEWEYGNTQNVFAMSYGMQGIAGDATNWLSARKGPCGKDGFGDPVELWHLYCISQ